MRADRAHKPLGNKCLYHGREQERLNVHIQQTGDAAHRIVRVQRTEDKVSSHRRADRNVRRLHVANFTHHDDVRVLPQNVAETFREGQIDLWFHVNLRHTG